MPTPHIRLRQIRPQSPWAWLFAIPLLLLAFLLAIVFFLVALVTGFVAALFGRPKRRPLQPRGSRIIDAEYEIESDADKE